jgi:hypothetical protein
MKLGLIMPIFNGYDEGILFVFTYSIPYSIKWDLSMEDYLNKGVSYATSHT